MFFLHLTDTNVFISALASVYCYTLEVLGQCKDKTFDITGLILDKDTETTIIPIFKQNDSHPDSQLRLWRNVFHFGYGPSKNKTEQNNGIRPVFKQLISMPAHVCSCMCILSQGDMTHL